MKKSIISKVCCFLFFSINHVFSEQIILDEEIDSILSKWAKILSKAASLNLHSKIFVIKSNEINAVALQTGEILLCSKIFLKTEHVEEILGVLSHEIGHIKGAHYSKITNAMLSSAAPSIASLILGTAICFF